MRQVLPFAIRSFASDTSSEFINADLHRCCHGYGIRSTRCRLYRKDDNAHYALAQHPALPRLRARRPPLRAADREPIKAASTRSPGLHLCQAELPLLAAADKAAIRELLDASERTSFAFKRKLPEADFPHARRYLLGLIEDGLASLPLRHLLTTGQMLPLSTDRLESIWSWMPLRLKQIGLRWSAPGALNMLARLPRPCPAPKALRGGCGRPWRQEAFPNLGLDHLSGHGLGAKCHNLSATQVPPPQCQEHEMLVTMKANLFVQSTCISTRKTEALCYTERHQLFVQALAPRPWQLATFSRLPWH